MGENLRRLAEFIQKPDMAPSNAIVLCTDRNHMNYLKRFYREVPIIGYLPYAGKESASERHPISERSIDVLYAGDLSTSFLNNIMPDFSKYREFDAKKICERAYYDLIKNLWKTTEQALEENLLASIYMKEAFCGFKDSAEQREMILFELEELETLPGQIKELLENAKLAQGIADGGMKRLRNFIHGSRRILLDNGRERKIVSLEKPYEGLRYIFKEGEGK